jgi:hypothetical protein
MDRKAIIDALTNAIEIKLCGSEGFPGCLEPLLVHFNSE